MKALETRNKGRSCRAVYVRDHRSQVKVLKEIPEGQGNSMPTVSSEGVAQAIRGIMKGVLAEEVMFVCIGTDRSTGDSLGPIAGTLLAQAGYEVIGTLGEPVHAENLDDRLKLIRPGKIVVGIDSTLGHPLMIGSFTIASGPVKPGEGIGKKLTPVGDFHITGTVNIAGAMGQFLLLTTRLSLVMTMANVIVDAIRQAMPLQHAIYRTETAAALAMPISFDTEPTISF